MSRARRWFDGRSGSNARSPNTARHYPSGSIVVVVAEHGPRRRRKFAHHDHDRLCTGLDGAVVDEVFDDPFDVIEQLALSFTEAFDRHGRLRLVEIDDHDLRLAGFILLSRLPLFGSARRGGCHLHLLQLSSSSSSSSNSIFGIPNGDALRISLRAFLRAFMKFPGSSIIQLFPPLATESRCR